MKSYFIDGATARPIQILAVVVALAIMLTLAAGDQKIQRETQQKTQQEIWPAHWWFIPESPDSKGDAS